MFVNISFVGIHRYYFLIVMLNVIVQFIKNLNTHTYCNSNSNEFSHLVKLRVVVMKKKTCANIAVAQLVSMTSHH